MNRTRPSSPPTSSLQLVASRASRLLAAWLLFGGSLVAQEQTTPNSSVLAKPICYLENKDINESSGLAVSRRNPEIIWTHNDSGDKPRLFAFDRRGRHLGTCKLSEADAHDWEDMGSFTLRGQPFLFVADVGNSRPKDVLPTIYVLSEPESPKDDIPVGKRIEFSYEGEQVDCEAVTFDPATADFYLIEKRHIKQTLLPSRVYRLAWPSKGSTSPSVAKLIATVSIPFLPTGMDMTDDSRKIVVNSYANGFLFVRSADETWDEAFKRRGKPIQLPLREQGESVCFNHDGTTLLLTSENKQGSCPLFEIPLVDTLVNDPPRPSPPITNPSSNP